MSFSEEELKNYKIFLENHYKDLQLKCHGKEVEIIQYFKTHTTLLKTKSNSKLKDFMENYLSYRKIFCNYNKFSCINFWLLIYENACIISENSAKGWHGYKIIGPRVNSVAESDIFESTGEVCKFVETYFAYNLRQLIPYICPNCNQGLCVDYSRTVDNGIVYTCSKCKSEMIDLF